VRVKLHSYDIAGFEKDRGAYYRSWWLRNGNTFVRDRDPHVGNDF
jgi:hypothetical protein